MTHENCAYLEELARPKDFATLFRYYWYRDFPISPKAVGALRTDWTRHIDIVVRNVADLMGLYTRFEAGKRSDAILRCAHGQDIIAVEWEWTGVHDKDLTEKLRKKKGLRYAVFVSYSDVSSDMLKPDEDRQYVEQVWKGASFPLLLILVEYSRVKRKEAFSGRRFGKLLIYLQ